MIDFYPLNAILPNLAHKVNKFNYTIVKKGAKILLLFEIFCIFASKFACLDAFLLGGDTRFYDLLVSHSWCSAHWHFWFVFFFVAYDAFCCEQHSCN